MRQLIKHFLWVALLAAGLQTIQAFVPAGPIGNGGDRYQVPAIGYGLPGDIVAPKNIGEEYRRNTPVLYYTYDANFLDFFGSNGVVSVDGAFSIINGLTNVSSYSSTLSEFPLAAQGINYTASALGLTDLKSETLSLMMEQMGLAEPERYVWTLHDRFLPPNGKCPLDEEYLVIQRNLDPITSPTSQVQYSSYVNGTLYSYIIDEFCTGTLLAETVPFAPDRNAPTFTAVASLGAGLELGGFYLGLTRDDVGGLRYLLRTNNVNFETPALDATLTVITTNLTSQQQYPVNSNSPSGFGTFDLGLLISSSRTNDPATLQALFPGVIVATSSNYFILATNTVVTSYFTNFIGEPAGSPPHLKVVTNLTFFPQSIYVTTFANIVTNHYHSNSIATIQTITVAPQVGAPVGSPSKTNISNKTITYTNVPSGDYILLSADLCPVNLIKTLQTNVFATTNLITGAGTNVTTASNSTTFAFIQASITYFTNFIYVVNPVDCTQSSNTTGLYQGIENVKFVRANFDSLIGQFFQPITNTYTMGFVENSKLSNRKFTRVVTRPDFLLTAQDLANGPGGPLVVGGAARNITFNQANVLPGLAGPGTIETPTVFTYDKVGNIFENGSLAFNNLATNQFLTEFTQTPLPVFTWASFDGSTNEPVVYPNGTSIENLENQILVQVSPPPPNLPDGNSNGDVYPGVVFSATGGSFSPPFTWSVAFGSGGLPDGLFLSPDGTLSGTPTQAGTYDFIVQLTDSLSRTVQWNYTITIQ